MEVSGFVEQIDAFVEGNETSSYSIGVKFDGEKIQSITINGKEYDSLMEGRRFTGPRSFLIGDTDFSISGATLSLEKTKGNGRESIHIGDQLSQEVKDFLQGIGSLDKSIDTRQKRIESAMLVIDDQGIDIFETHENRKYFNDIYDNWEALSSEQKSEFKDLIKLYIELKDVEYGLGEIIVDESFEIKKGKEGYNRAFIVLDKYTTYDGDLPVGNYEE
ncbi:hypothetical protein OAN96_01210 [Candidatus Gracilibacteria bacterium]|nr:hypothetical protein [Candidatus Gracilibacteria bacterium]